MGIDSLQNGLSDALGMVKANPVATALGAGVVGASIIGATVALAKKKRKKSSKSKYSRKKSSSRRSRKGRRTPRTAGKGRDTSRKRIRYTKKGQPYVIMASGKARFIKKRNAKFSHKRKGGRY